MLERVIQIKELPVDVDFAKTPEGRKEEAKYYDELLPRGRIYHEAYFYRSSSGEEKFQYNPDAKESKFVVVKLKDKTDEDYTGNINNDLILAARKGDTEYIQNLIIRGADINSTDFQGNTALMDAKNLESARILLKVKIDVNLQNKYGATALIKAADRDAREIVDLLLQNGAKINLKDRYGYTALMTAARNGHVSIVAMLIKKGANGTVANNIGQTALTLAREKGYSKIVQLLESSGIFQ